MSKYKITLNGKAYEMEVELLSDAQAAVAKEAKVLTSSKTVSEKAAPAPAAPSGSSPKTSGTGAGSVNSPMPGTILKVNLNEGDSVKAGQAVVVLEAMKMENDINAPKDGVIKSIAVSKGQTVAAGEFLFEVE